MLAGGDGRGGDGGGCWVRRGLGDGCVDVSGMTCWPSKGEARFRMPKKDKSGRSGRAVVGVQPDPVIDAYTRDIDRTLLRENLKLTVEERFLKLMELQRFATELRRAGQHARR